MTDDPRAARRALVRRRTLELVGGVVLLHSAALAVYYLAGIAGAPPKTRTTFTVVWLFATAIVVALLLKRVRVVRMRR